MYDGDLRKAGNGTFVPRVGQRIIVLDCAPQYRPIGVRTEICRIVGSTAASIRAHAVREMRRVMKAARKGVERLERQWFAFKPTDRNTADCGRVHPCNVFSDSLVE